MIRLLGTGGGGGCGRGDGDGDGAVWGNGEETVSFRAVSLTAATARVGQVC